MDAAVDPDHLKYLNALVATLAEDAPEGTDLVMSTARADNGYRLTLSATAPDTTLNAILSLDPNDCHDLTCLHCVAAANEAITQQERALMELLRGNAFFFSALAENMFRLYGSTTATVQQTGAMPVI